MSDYKEELTANLKAFRKLGHDLLKVDYVDGCGVEEGVDMVTLQPSQVSEAVSALLECDSSRLYMRTPLGQIIWVSFVLGNEAGVAVADWLIPRDSSEAGALSVAVAEVSEHQEWLHESIDDAVKRHDDELLKGGERPSEDQSWETDGDGYLINPPSGKPQEGGWNDQSWETDGDGYLINP